MTVRPIGNLELLRQNRPEKMPFAEQVLIPLFDELSKIDGLNLYLDIYGPFLDIANTDGYLLHYDIADNGDISFNFVFSGDDEGEGAYTIYRGNSTEKFLDAFFQQIKTDHGFAEHTALDALLVETKQKLPEQFKSKPGADSAMSARPR